MGISGEAKDEIFEWDGSLWIPAPADNPAGKLLSSTSFLVKNSSALTMELHLDRMIRQAKFWNLEFPMDAWISALTIIHSFQNCWPRIDMHENGELVLKIRSIPSTTESVSLMTWNGDDPRNTPEIKGPDLHSLLQARASINQQGADEGIICDASGFVCEGFTTGLLWWDIDVLCLPTEKQPKLISTAVQAILGIAVGLGVEVRAEEITPEQLQGKSVWVVNALHGIRYAESWVNGPEIVANQEKATLWKMMLESLRQEIPRVE